MTHEIDFERMQREAEQQLAQVREAQGALGEVEVVVSSEDERITATMTAAKGLTTLELDPRVMRMASEDLAAAIVTLVQDASAKLQQELYARMDGILGDASPTKYLTGEADAEQAVEEMASTFKTTISEAEAEIEKIRRSMGL